MEQRRKLRFWLGASTALAMLLMLVIVALVNVQAAPLRQGGPVVTNPTIRTADAVSGSDPLRDRPPLWDTYGDLYVLPRKELPNRTNPAQPQGEDPVLQDAPPVPSLPGPGLTFDGVSNVNGVLPPDTNGDVGPNHYVQSVNLAFGIWDKNGNKLYGPANINTIWQGFGGVCQSSNDGDPIVQYDHLADRWLISQFALPNYPFGPFYECIAISQTPDPTGAYWRYQFQVSNSKMNDYPKIGVWPDGYYMTMNQFSQGSLNWGGQGVAVFERSQMLNGQAARMVYFDLYGTDANLSGMLPSDLDGPAPPAGTPNYFAQIDDSAWGGTANDQMQIWEFRVNWSNPGSSTFSRVAQLPVASFDSDMCGYNRNCIPQPGGTKVDAISDRLMYRLQYRNFGGQETLVVNHTVDVNGQDLAGVRWYEFRKTGGPWSVYQQGTFSPDSTRRWMGSAAMDGLGNLAIGYSASSTSVYPSLRYVGRTPGDPLGTLPQGETTLWAGTGFQSHSSGRWGDYSTLSIDPTDGCTFWYTNEYYVAGASSAGWQTRIGSFKFPSCGGGGTTPTPTPTPISSTPTPTPTSTPISPTATPTRTPTPTPNPGGTMHVGDLDGMGLKNNQRWQASVTIVVHDAAHNPLANAKVSGSWSNGASGTASCTTNSNGKCTVAKTNLRTSTTSVVFTVTNVTRSSYTYQSGANHDPDGDSNGTTITISRP